MEISREEVLKQDLGPNVVPGAVPPINTVHRI